MLNTYLHDLVSLFVVLDPIGIVPVFLALTQNMSQGERHKTAQKACIISLILLLTFTFVGDIFLDLISLQIPALQIAGGILLIISAVEMVIIHPTSIAAHAKKSDSNDITVFPLAIPLISGPGALITVILLKQKAEKGADFYLDHLALCGIIFLAIGVTYLSLSLAPHIKRLLGDTGSSVLTRVLGIILAAIAVEFILTGIKGAFF